MRDGWTESTLEEIADVVMGQSPDGKSYNQLGEGLPFMQGSAEFGEHHPLPEKWCSEPKKIAEPGDLLLSVRAPVGDTNFANQRIAVGRGLSIIRANSKSITEFIRFVIQLNVADMLASSGSGMFASITGKNLKEFIVLLPPLHEQKRIVDLISSVDSYTEALQQQLESAKKSRNAVLHELLTAGGDDWIETSLQEIAEVIMGQSPDGKSYNHTGEGLPFMQGSAEFGDHYPTPEKWCSDPKKIAEPGDLLLSVRAPVGDTNFANQRIAVGRGLSVIRANANSLTEFIRFVIQLNVSEMIASSGSGMFASITGKNLKEFKVLLPPLFEQKRIVEVISTIDKVISKTETAKNEAQNLRSGLLSDLLSGEHEIPSSYDTVIGAA